MFGSLGTVVRAQPVHMLVPNMNIAIDSPEVACFEAGDGVQESEVH